MDAHEIHAIHDIYIQYTYKLSIASRTEPIPNAPQFRSLLSTTPHMSSQLLGLTIIIVAATAILTQFQGGSACVSAWIFAWTPMQARTVLGGFFG